MNPHIPHCEYPASAQRATPPPPPAPLEHTYMMSLQSTVIFKLDGARAHAPRNLCVWAAFACAGCVICIWISISFGTVCMCVLKIDDNTLHTHHTHWSVCALMRGTFRIRYYPLGIICWAHSKSAWTRCLLNGYCFKQMIAFSITT